MAAIDKTYLHDFSDYALLRDWCISQGTVTDDYGNTFKPIDFLIDINEKEWNEWIHNQQERAKKNYGDNPNFNIEDCGEIPVWNTPKYFDVWLIRNCPIDFIQDRLKDQYDGFYSNTTFSEETDRTDYEAIKNYDSAYDHHKRNGIKNPHFKINWKYNFKLRDGKNVSWDIHVQDKDGKSYWYNEYDDCWVGPNELHEITCSDCMYCRYGDYNYHRFRRILSRWNLPEGAKVNVCITNFYNGHNYIIKQFTVTIKK